MAEPVLYVRDARGQEDAESDIGDDASRERCGVESVHVAGLELPPSARGVAIVDSTSALEAIAREPGRRVSTDRSGPWLTLVDALDHDVRARDRALAIVIDPSLARWRRGRWLALGAPIAWGAFVGVEIGEARGFSREVSQKLASDSFKSLEADPAYHDRVSLIRGKLERVVWIREAYAGLELVVGLIALGVIVRGARRGRAIVGTVGLGGAIWALHRAGVGEGCFVRGAAPLAWLFVALLGVSGAIASFVLSPSETRLVTRVRERLGVAPRGADAPLLGRFTSIDRRDFAAMLGAMAAGLALPELLRALLLLKLDDRVRAFAFVFACSAAFLGFLAWRREGSRARPPWTAIAGAALVGCGIVAACDVGARSLLEAGIDLQTCFGRGKASLQAVHDAVAHETTGARKETQSSLFNVLLTVLIAPLSEELLYRGTLQRVARRAIGARGAVAISALVFGAAHMLAFPNAFYQHFALGLAFACVFEMAGGAAIAVVASAGAHLMWNLYLAVLPTG